MSHHVYFKHSRDIYMVNRMLVKNLQIIADLMYYFSFQEPAVPPTKTCVMGSAKVSSLSCMISFLFKLCCWHCQRSLSDAKLSAVHPSVSLSSTFFQIKAFLSLIKKNWLNNHYFIKNVVAVAAYNRLASRSQAKFHTMKLSPLVRPCAAAPAHHIRPSITSIFASHVNGCESNHALYQWPSQAFIEYEERR